MLYYYLFSKLVEISCWICSHGEHKDERCGWGGVPEYQTKLSSLRLNKPLTKVVRNKILHRHMQRVRAYM